MSIPILRYYTLLQQYLWPQWPSLLALSVLLLAGIGLQLFPPQLMGHFLDLATAGAALTTLSHVALWIIGLVLTQQLCAVGAAYVGENVAWTATNQLRYHLLDHCLHLDLTFHHERTPGEMIERIDSDVTLLANFFSQVVILIGGNVLLLLGVLILLFQTDGRIGLIGLLLATVLLLTLSRLRNLGIPHAAAHRQSNAALYAYLEERLGGLEEIRANGAVAYTMHRFYGLLRTVFHKSLRENWIVSIPFAMLMILTSIRIVSVLALCASLYRANSMTIGTVYLVFHYMTLLSTPINALTRQLEEIQRAGGSLVRLQELQATRNRLADVLPSFAPAKLEKAMVTAPAAPCTQPAQRHALAVTFTHVSFGYGAGPTVLHDIHFHLPAGTKVGLLGHTGSGKSSLVRLLLRLYDPTQGHISLGDADGVDLRQFPLAQVREQVGLVTQHVELFQATLRENVTFWNPAIADAQIHQALAEVGLADWVATLPKGLDTMLAAGGRNLSAGEAQMVALARLFLRNPGLVILDEASARLDPTTEARLAAAMTRLLAGRTAIIIAHRLATVEQVDEILILDQGRLIEQGPRLLLAENPQSRFAQLLRTGLTEVLT
ncbi:MAG: ABC transporter ATP-binding protein [Caldilineaceae bacterium]|nr:ABC transporter ATP-binding protein [Caldilineaceae bacterium]